MIESVVPLSGYEVIQYDSYSFNNNVWLNFEVKHPISTIGDFLTIAFVPDGYNPSELTNGIAFCTYGNYVIPTMCHVLGKNDVQIFISSDVFTLKEYGTISTFIHVSYRI